MVWPVWTRDIRAVRAAWGVSPQPNSGALGSSARQKPACGRRMAELRCRNCRRRRWLIFGFMCIRGAQKLVALDFGDFVAEGHHGAGAEGAEFGSGVLHFGVCGQRAADDHASEIAETSAFEGRMVAELLGRLGRETYDDAGGWVPFRHESR